MPVYAEFRRDESVFAEATRGRANGRFMTAEAGADEHREAGQIHRPAGWVVRR